MAAYNRRIDSKGVAHGPDTSSTCELGLASRGTHAAGGNGGNTRGRRSRTGDVATSDARPCQSSGIKRRQVGRFLYRLVRHVASEESSSQGPTQLAAR